MNRNVVTLVAAAVLICVGNCVWGFEKPQTDAPTQQRIEGVARQVLSLPVKSISLEEAPFSDVIEWLRNKSSDELIFNVVVKWRVLQLENVDVDTPVTLKLRNTTIERVLVEVLDQISDQDPITFEADENIIKISTRSDFAKKLSTRAYDVEDLLMRISHFSGSPQIDISGAVGGGTGAGRGVERVFSAGTGGGNNDRGSATGQIDDEQANAIMNMIRETIEPESWNTAGGPGTIVMFNNQIVIRNSKAVHDALVAPR